MKEVFYVFKFDSNHRELVYDGIRLSYDLKAVKYMTEEEASDLASDIKASYGVRIIDG